MKKPIFTIFCFLLTAFWSLQAAFTPESGVKYYIVQNLPSSQLVIGANGTQPIVANAAYVDAQKFEFISTGDANTYYIKNAAEMYLNRSTANAWTTIYQNTINGDHSKWTIEGTDVNNLRLKVKTSTYLASDNVSNGQYLYCNKENNHVNGAFKLVNVADVKQVSYSVTGLTVGATYKFQFTYTQNAADTDVADVFVATLPTTGKATAWSNAVYTTTLDAQTNAQTGEISFTALNTSGYIVFRNSTISTISPKFNIGISDLTAIETDAFKLTITASSTTEIAPTQAIAPVSQVLATFENNGTADLLTISTTEGNYTATYFTEEPAIRDNIDKTGVNVSNKSLKAINNVTTPNWWGNFVYLVMNNPITITDNQRYLKFKAYRSVQPNSFRVAVNNTPDGKIVYDNKLSQTGTWQSVVVDLKNYIGQELNYLSIAFDCNWGNPTSNDPATFMFDDFELANNSLQPVTFSLSTYPTEGGSTIGSSANGYYSPGQILNLQATANPDYIFVGWMLNQVQMSTDATYSPTVVGDKNLNYIAYFKKNNEVYPSLEVTGNHYIIEDFEQGKQIFRNRDFPFEAIPDAFTGWKYLKISANSGYTPPGFEGMGDAPSYEIKAAQTGTVYAMLATAEKPANAEAWATANAWELVPVYSLAYGVNDPNKVLAFYKKQFTAGE